MHAWFHEVVGYLTDLLGTDQSFACRVTGEDTDSIRFNAGRVRQAGTIRQRELGLQLVEGDRQVYGTIELAGDITADRFPLRRLHGELSALLETAPPDPHLSFPESVESTEDREVDLLPAPGEVLPTLLQAGEPFDGVGIYLGGRIVEGVATSLGLRRWFETYTFDLDISFCLGLSARDRDRSVKVTLGGPRWDPTHLEKHFERAREKAERLRLDREKLEPGSYRAYIAPSGLKAILRTLCWRGAFSHRAVANGTSPFAELHRGGRRLSPAVSIFENHGLGWTAPFNSGGFRRFPSLGLIEQGAPRRLCVAPRTGREFDLPHTGAEAGEFPASFEIEAGDIPLDEVAARVGDGLYLDHLHYLNLSDRATASVTGLTRFGAFRVRDGKIAEPLEVVRFDDSVLDLLGDRLVGLTAERERVPEARSYSRRALGGGLLPGAVVDGFRIVS